MKDCWRNILIRYLKLWITFLLMCIMCTIFDKIAIRWFCRWRYCKISQRVSIIKRAPSAYTLQSTSMRFKFHRTKSNAGGVYSFYEKSPARSSYRIHLEASSRVKPRPFDHYFVFQRFFRNFRLYLDIFLQFEYCLQAFLCVVSWFWA